MTLINTKQLAAMLGITANGIYERIRMGRTMPAHIQLGKKRMYSLEDVQAWIAANKVTA